MRDTNMGLLLVVLSILPGGALVAADLPENFPADVPVADYMQVVSVTVVGDDMMVDLHAPGRSLADVVGWFQSGMAEAGWQSDGESIMARKAILAYSKNGRRCGVSVTNFVLDASMQMDETIKGVTLQFSADDKTADGASEAAAEAAATIAQ